jgi:hypothetical protein
MIDDEAGESRNDDPKAGGGYASAPLDRRSVPRRLTCHGDRNSFPTLTLRCATSERTSDCTLQNDIHSNAEVLTHKIIWLNLAIVIGIRTELAI